jgi:uncharacterized protein
MGGGGWRQPAICSGNRSNISYLNIRTLVAGDFLHRHQQRREMRITMREQFTATLKSAMKAGDKRRVDTVRMITAALKDRDIEARGQGKEVSDADILALLQKMVKSRQESMEIYDKNGRPELAQQEREEIAIIQEFLPKQMSDDEVQAAIKAAIAETGAASVKDMGKVVGALKAKYTGQMDFAKASAAVKGLLNG